ATRPIRGPARGRTCSGCSRRRCELPRRERAMTAPLKIGISACFFHPDGERKAAPSKTLLWIEQSTAHWVLSEDALPVMIPSLQGETFRGAITVADYAQWLD